jgi:hypothetical protein
VLGGVRGPGLTVIVPVADRLHKVNMQVVTMPIPAQRLNQGLELLIDSPALDWGVHIDRVEIKDVALPESMKRSMSRQAEAERERRSRIITADGELQASSKLAQAARVMAEQPAALQLRLLQTVVDVAAEKNSTLVLPFPVELLRFLERGTPAALPTLPRPARVAEGDQPERRAAHPSACRGGPSDDPRRIFGGSPFAELLSRLRPFVGAGTNAG